MSRPMTTIIELGKKALKRYSNNLTRLRALELESKVAEYLKLKDKLTDDQKIIIEAARENKEDMRNGNVEVKVAQVWKKWYDPTILRREATPKEWEEIEKCLETEVDKIRFENLIKEDRVRKELKQNAFREEESTPRVSIKEIND